MGLPNESNELSKSTLKLDMRKTNQFILMILASLMLSSCATLFGGKVTEHQKTRPAPGEPARQIRIVPLVFDLLLFWPSLAIDFATGAIYKPLKNSDQPAKKESSNEKMY